LGTLPAKEGKVQDPLVWADDCLARANVEVDPEAKAAFVQLAEEFRAVAAEIEGLVSTYDALVVRKVTGQVTSAVMH
jgi:hypothetical protein